MPAQDLTRAFLTDPDQDSRRIELIAFIGPNADKFFPTYDTWRATVLRLPGEKRPRRAFGFVGTAFLLGPTWFFYRKLWIWAVAIVLLMVAFAFIPHASRLGLGLSVALATFAKQAYLGHAIKRITALRGSAPIADLALLQREGGVSKPAGWISGTLVVLLMLLSLVSIIYLAKNGGIPQDL